MTSVRRGYMPSDEKDFSKDNLTILRQTQEELLYLLEHNYPIKSASTFIGNHYMLSERQRMAIVRATATQKILEERNIKKVTGNLQGESVYLDGLNIIITLEVALAGSTLIRCMDQTIRDLAGLRGTYRLIDDTDKAIFLIGDKLKEMQIQEAVFYLDAPVSNTGRLKQRIQELLAEYPFLIRVELVINADVMLKKQKNVITSDAIILNTCESFINLTAEIIRAKLPEVKCINLSDKANTIDLK